MEFSKPAVVYSLNEARERLGHSYKDATRANPKDLGMNLKKGD
jgi:hypothetical protein